MHRAFFLAFVLLWSVPPGLSSGQEALPKLDWKTLFVGVTQTQFQLESPRLIRAWVVKIDLTTPGLEFLATPANGEKKGETDGLKTSHFLKKHQLDVAINAAPFVPVELTEHQPHDVSGLAISRGQLVSPAPERGGLPALLITKDNKAKIAAPPFDTKDVWNAVSGFSIVLKNGEVQPSGDDLHPRTAVGISGDGRFLYWLVVDGRQKSWSGGATTQEIGHWLKLLGCAEGINLDGGGTSTLVVADEKGAPKVLNRPIHLGIAGTERPSASHLGLKVRQAEKK